jgi:hypothetical protein
MKSKLKELNLQLPGSAPAAGLLLTVQGFALPGN